MRKLIVAVGLTFALVACDRGRARAEAVATPIAAQLKSDTHGVWLRYRGERRREIPPSEQPRSVQQLKPKRVWAGTEGVFLETYDRYVESAGIFIRHDPAFVPPVSGDPGFEQIAPEIYWFFAPG
jgi:hypothetical protein